MKQLLSITALAVLVSACGGGSGGGSNDPIGGNAPKEDTNIAAASEGASATSAFNSDTATNIIDEKEDTTWISTPDTPIVIEFDSAENIKKISIKQAESSVSVGTNPDVLVELSTDGKTYKTSSITVISGGDIPCNTTTINPTLLECSMDEYEAKYLKITTKNGKSFEFQEVEVIASK